MDETTTLIVIALAAMTVLGVGFGIFLALASRAFHVQEDPRVEKIEDCLPGVNCGACGYTGCRSYAEAVVEGEKVGLCTVGGPEVAEMIADIMGVETTDLGSKRAVVHCSGGRSRCQQRAAYDGIQDCRAAHLIAGGPKACSYGCLGFGTCAEVCPFDAITMSEDRLPVIDPEKCTACGACVEACPRDLISLLDSRYTWVLACSSHEKGKAVKAVCETGCIACNLCAKKDPNEAITMEDNLPVLDYEKADGDFSVAAEVCPMDCYVNLAEKEQSEEPAEPAEAPA